MDWNEFKNNKAAFWTVVILGINVLLFTVIEVATWRATNKVIQRLQKDYSPSPYGPGLDPDRVNIDSLRKKTSSIAEPRRTTFLDQWESDRSNP
jgi:hypothetical protein